MVNDLRHRCTTMLRGLTDSSALSSNGSKITCELSLLKWLILLPFKYLDKCAGGHDATTRPKRPEYLYMDLTHTYCVTTGTRSPILEILCLRYRCAAGIIQTPCDKYFAQDAHGAAVAFVGCL